MKTTTLITLQCIVAFSTAQAGTSVAPTDFAATPGPAGVNTLLRNNGAPRTYQLQFTSAALGGLPVGATITELRFRLRTNAAPATSFPVADITWPDYEVTLAQAANPVSAMSATFASNMVAPVRVKDGPLLLRANSFGTAAGVNPFGSLIVFDTPYLYEGGDLVMLFSHPGSDSSNTAYLDAASSSTAGYGTAFRALSANSFNAASGVSASAIIAQIVFAYEGTVLNVELAPDLVQDSKPSGTPHHGVNHGALWLASSTDNRPLPMTRQGLMRFTSTERNQILVPPDADFNTAQGAITFWIRSGGITPGGNEGAVIIDHRQPDAGDVIVQDDLGMIFWQPNALYSAHGARTVSDGNWHHVAYVFDQALGATTSLFVDGLLDTVSPANPIAWSWPEQQLEIGLSHDTYWRAFNGELDDIRFYRRLLSSSEVQQIYAGDPTLVGESDLAGRYNFDGPPGGHLLTWPRGKLESAPTVTGPWSTVVGAVSPYPLTDRVGSGFYRLRL